MPADPGRLLRLGWLDGSSSWSATFSRSFMIMIMRLASFYSWWRGCNIVRPASHLVQVGGAIGKKLVGGVWRSRFAHPRILEFGVVVYLAALQSSICIGFSASGAWPVSVVRSREVSLPRRLQMYYLYGKINRGHGIWPLFGGCPLLGESIISGFTVYPYYNGKIWRIRLLNILASF